MSWGVNTQVERTWSESEIEKVGGKKDAETKNVGNKTQVVQKDDEEVETVT